MDRRGFLKSSVSGGLVASISLDEITDTAGSHPQSKEVAPIRFPHLLNIRADAEWAVTFSVHWIASLLRLQPIIRWRSLSPTQWMCLRYYHPDTRLQIPDVLNDPTPWFTHEDLESPDSDRPFIVIVNPEEQERKNPARYRELMNAILTDHKPICILVDNRMRMNSNLHRAYKDLYQDIFRDAHPYYRVLCSLGQDVELVTEDFDEKQYHALTDKLFGEIGSA